MSERGGPEQLMARARDRLAHGDIVGAIALLKQLLALDPEDGYAHAMLAMCLVATKQVRAARVEAEAAIQCDPDDAVSHRAMGAVEQAERRLDKAEASFRHAIGLSPDDPDIYVQLVKLLRMRARRDEEMLQLALELAPDDPDVLVAAAYDAYDRRALDEAERYAQEALEEDPEHVDALVAMGWIHLRRGDVTEAHEHARMAVHGGPTDPDALELLAAIKARKNPIIGLWWRWSMWMSSFGDDRSTLILLGMFVVYRLSTTIAEDFGRVDIANAVRMAWLGFVAYTWIAPQVWQRMLRRDIDPVTMRDDY